MSDTPAMRRAQLIAHVFNAAALIKGALPAAKVMAESGEIHATMPMAIASNLSQLMGLLDRLVPPSGGD